MSGADTTTPYETDFNLLYTVYSIPNMVLPFFGGFFVDKLGAPLCLVVFASLILAGQTLFAFGATVQSWTFMLAGRVLFGLGGENLTVAQSALLAQWFKGKELAFAFGLNLSISRLGSVINNYVSPAVASSISTPMALWVGMLVCGGSLVTAVLIWPIERSVARRIDDSTRASEDLTASLLSDEAPVSPNRSKSYSLDGVRAVSTERMSASALKASKSPDPSPDSEAIHLSDAKNFGAIFWLLSLSCLVVYGCVLPFNNVASGILSERNYFMDPPSSCALTYPTNCTSGTLAPKGGNPTTSNCPGDDYAPVLPDSIVYNSCPEGVTCDDDSYVFYDLEDSDIDCNDKFWKDGCTADYCKASEDAASKSAQIMSIPYFMSAALSPVLGFVVDKVGRRAIIASLAPLMLIAVHLSLGFTSGSPVFPLIGQGIAYSLFAAVLWPSVPFSVEEKSIGTAYGLITAIQNSGLAAFPLIISVIYNNSDNKYIPNVEIFFVACAVCGVFVGLALNIMDAKRGGLLNAPAVGKKPEDDVDTPPTPQMQT